MEGLDIAEFLVYNDRAVLIGGNNEALIIHATKAQKLTDGNIEKIVSDLIKSYFPNFSLW
jgi:hypothetical protein